MSQFVQAIPHTEEYNKRIGDHGVDPLTHCCVCAKRLPKKRHDDKGIWLIMCEGGTHMAKIGTEDANDPGFMGEYAVGSDCAKKFAAKLEGFLIKRK